MMKRRTFTLLALSFVLGLCLMGPGTVAATNAEQTTSVPAASLATAIAEAEEGDTIKVDGGTYAGTLTIDKRVTLLGSNWPTIDGQNEGTVVNITAPGTIISGFVIKNSGSSLDQENSGVAVEAERVTLANNRFEDTLFGIYLKSAHHSIVRGNEISSQDLAVPRRGDPIRVWYSNDVLIEDNRVHLGRDVVLWYSERLTLRGNEVIDGRYGLHFMYCDDALIEKNSLLNNSVGAFMMYSRRVNIHNNVIAGNRGPSGFGIGLKAMDDTVIENNLLLDNRIGVHLDTSPREVDSIGKFSGNVFAYNDIGVELMPSVRHNAFSGNSFVENEEQVGVAGGGLLRENEWSVDEKGNYWSDYAGYDAAGDGQGDIPYRSEKLFEELMARQPELRLFVHSPAVNAIDFAARAFPQVKPQPRLEDAQPLMAPEVPAGTPSLPQASRSGGLWSGLILLLLAGGILALPALRLQLIPAAKWRSAGATYRVKPHD